MGRDREVDRSSDLLMRVGWKREKWFPCAAGRLCPMRVPGTHFVADMPGTSRAMT